MKIAYVLPSPLSRTEAGKMEMDRRESILKTFAAPGTIIDIHDTDEGPASIESLYEEYLSIPKTVEKMIQLEQQGYDAAILGVPVVNPGRISVKMAEALVGTGLTHSKLGYITPPKIKLGKVKSTEDLLVRR